MMQGGKPPNINTQEDITMKKNLTELVFILDRSGSMAGMEADTIGGFNAMIEKQKVEPGEAYVSTVLFDTTSTVVHDRVRVAEVQPMTRRDYTPGGCTALLDAVGDAIRHIGNVHKYAREEDVPEKTVFVITTDGLENASRRHSLADVKQLISRQKEKYGWEFLFLGANIDAVGTAASMGISADRAANFRCDSRGMEKNYEAINVAVHRLRCSMPLQVDWKAEVEADCNSRK